MMVYDKKYKFLVIFFVCVFGNNQIVWCRPEPAAASDEISMSLSVITSNNAESGIIEGNSLQSVNIEINNYIGDDESDESDRGKKKC